MKFDLIVLQETWVEKEKEKKLLNKLYKNFDWKLKSAIKKRKKGRAVGG